MHDRIKETILQFLDNHNTMSLATSRGNNPFAASLFYANDGFTIYFLSNPHSDHSMNFSQNPNVAITINKDYSEWRMIKGLQINGKAYKVSEEELPAAIKSYSKKHPFVKFICRDGNPTFRMAGVRFFKVIPERIRLIDNEVAFGYKVEIRI
ncbi:MAG TPA: pyridoxamine 5'-phosphate oxidase family protein [Thermodesulfobacteriota bacterium]|nr:pyridoxamine 5'-phosphate oxidase family protein [Thermodesulfobacteriota bacterium]